MFVPQPLEDSLGRVPLFLRRLPVVHQYLLNDRQEGFQLPLRSRLTLAIARRLIMRQDLLERTEYFDPKNLNVQAVPERSVLLTTPDDTEVQALVAAGRLRMLALIPEPADPPSFAIFQR